MSSSLMCNYVFRAGWAQCLSLPELFYLYCDEPEVIQLKNLMPANPRVNTETPAFFPHPCLQHILYHILYTLMTHGKI